MCCTINISIEHAKESYVIVTDLSPLPLRTKDVVAEVTAPVIFAVVEIQVSKVPTVFVANLTNVVPGRVSVMLV